MCGVAVKRAIGVYLALVALAVAAQFVAYPLYAYEGDNLDAANDTWLVLDWLMFVGLMLAVVTTFRAKQQSDAGSSADLRRWFGANAMFYGTVLLTLAFVPNWFAAAWSEGDDSTIWHLIDTALPVLFAVQARRLWRTTPAEPTG